MERFITHNAQEIDIQSTSAQGRLNVSHATLVAAFGQPMPSTDFKSDAIWNIEFVDGTVASIYNWKNGKRYLGADGIPTQNITDWVVGGHTPRVLSRIRDILGSVTREQRVAA